MRYHNITHDDMLNGEGLRVVLWLSGCSHHCKGCQNPITWNPNDGKLFGTDEIKEILEELNHPYISGITFSGGDPLHENNVVGVLKLIELIRERFKNKKDIWLYTGYRIDNLLSKDVNEDPVSSIRLRIIKLIDVLVDGPFIEELINVKYPWAGSTNQRVIDVQKSLSTGWNNIVLYKKEFK